MQRLCLQNVSCRDGAVNRSYTRCTARRRLFDGRWWRYRHV